MLFDPNASHGAVIGRMRLIGIPCVAVFSKVMEIVIGLENRVVLQHPIVFVRDEGPKQFCDETAVVHRCDIVAEIVEKGAHDRFLVGTVALCQRGGLQPVFEHIDRQRAAVFVLERDEHFQHPVGREGVLGFQVGLEDIVVLLRRIGEVAKSQLFHGATRSCRVIRPRS
jgi:hypothetical protein